MSVESWIEKYPEAAAQAMAALAALREEISKLPQQQMVALAELNNLLARSLIRNGNLEIGQKIL